LTPGVSRTPLPRGPFFARMQRYAGQNWPSEPKA
jgi:hypothetical protein